MFLSTWEERSQVLQVEVRSASAGTRERVPEGPGCVLVDAGPVPDEDPVGFEAGERPGRFQPEGGVDPEALAAGEEVLGRTDCLRYDEYSVLPVGEGGFGPREVVDDRLGPIARVREFAREALDGRVDVSRDAAQRFRKIDRDLVAPCDRPCIAFVPVEEDDHTRDVPEFCEEVVEPRGVDRIHDPHLAIDGQGVARTLHGFLGVCDPPDTARGRFVAGLEPVDFRPLRRRPGIFQWHVTGYGPTPQKMPTQTTGVDPPTDRSSSCGTAAPPGDPRTFAPGVRNGPMLSGPRWLALEVKYLDRARSFYEAFLDLAVRRETDTEATLAVGETDLILRAPSTVPRGGLHTHYAMTVPAAEYDDWYDRLDERFDLVEHQFGAARSLYFYDTEGNCVELGERADADGPGVSGVFEVVFEVEDLKRALEFYRTLGFDVVDRGEDRNRVRLSCSGFDIELWEPHLGLADARGGVHVDIGIGATDPDGRADALADEALAVEPVDGGVRLRDPDGHYLTLLA